MGQRQHHAATQAAGRTAIQVLTYVHTRTRTYIGILIPSSTVTGTDVATDVDVNSVLSPDILATIVESSRVRHMLSQRRHALSK